MPNEAAAELVRSLLQAEGIESMLRQTDYGAGSMDGLRGGQQEVVVRRRDYETAQALISGS